MALSPVLNQKLPADAKELIYVKTNIGGFIFDAFLNTSHTSTLKITEFPVMIGGSISDHAYLEPRTLTMEVGMSDVAQSVISGQFEGGWSRSVKAYQVLMELQAQRIPMQVLTRLNLYKNLLIETLSVPDDYKTLYGLRASVTMKEVLVATTKTVKISARPQTTNSTNRGQPEPAEPNESILYQLFGKKGG